MNYYSVYSFQGSTIPSNAKVVVHWSNQFKKRQNAGMAYVSLGRSERLKDIYIKGKVDPQGILASCEALEETERLERIFDKRVEKYQEKAKHFWKVCSLNVRSLHCHKEDVAKDNFMTSGDIFALNETWLKPSILRHEQLDLKYHSPL